MNIEIREWKGGLDERPDWDEFYLALCFVLAQKSIDPSTVHGSLLVSKDKKILSAGYNGPLSGIEDSLVPLTRPDKYKHIIHSEENLLLSYNGNAEDLIGSTIYITGVPCHRCLRMLLQKGIRRFVVADAGLSYVGSDDNEEIKVKEFMLSQYDDVELIKYNDINKIRDVIVKALSYIEYKINDINI
jgi:deoxycytidylate deaminase